MSAIKIDPGLGAAKLPDRNLKLQQTAQKLEAVFVEHLFKAMRETVPEGGLIDGGSGEEIFTSLLDRHLADQVPSGWDRGLGAAIYRQLQSSVTTEQDSADTSREPSKGE
jgi:peptidoglycan hydrolase FlgJ